MAHIQGLCITQWGQVTQLLRRENQIFYFKTESGLEVDFLTLDPNENLKLIQVCYDLNKENLEREINPLLESKKDKRLNHAQFTLICGFRIDPRLEIPSFIEVRTAWDYLSS